MWSSLSPSMTALVVPLLVISLVGMSSGQTEKPCPYAKYVSQGQTHTMCLPANSSCKIVTSGVSASDQNLILKNHNDLRNQIASGKQTTANGVQLPSATDMRLMVWNTELAKIAQAHANQCTLTFECSECRSTEDYITGENLYYSYSQTPPSRSQWQQAVKYWAAGGRTITSIHYYAGRPGSFAQMIWGQTKDIGCGFTRFRGNPRNARYIDYYVCVYGPAGNFRDQDIYEEGDVCSDCGFNESCCGNNCSASGTTPTYPYLCQ